MILNGGRGLDGSMNGWTAPGSFFVQFFDFYFEVEYEDKNVSFSG
jgi:hypothetical protein